jgi:hypothetical protein
MSAESQPQSKSYTETYVIEELEAPDCLSMTPYG